MGSADDEPRARVVLVLGGRDVPLGPVDPSTRCDLRLVDDLLRLRLAAARLGGTIRLTHVRPDLRELFDLVGLGDTVGLPEESDGGSRQASMRSGRPNRGKSSG